VLHDVLDAAGFDVDPAGFDQTVAELLLVLGHVPFLRLHLDAVEGAVLDCDTVGNALRGSESLKDRKVKNASKVEVIADLIFDLGLFCQMRLRLLVSGASGLA
jgi:hypothetical protein